MISINGWICIRESFNEEGEDENKFDSIIQKIESEISNNLVYENEYYDLKSINGETYLTLTIGHNHRVEHPFGFIKWIAEIAIGSFGIIYVFDDEDIDRKNNNSFKVWRIKKGIVEELDDPFLSPIIPQIEE